MSPLASWSLLLAVVLGGALIWNFVYLARCELEKRRRWTAHVQQLRDRQLRGGGR